MKRRGLKAIVALSVAGCAVPLAWNAKPLLVWNVTASAPVGLYRRSFGALQDAAWVLAIPAPKAAEMMAKRGYLPLKVPMVKRIAALSGDTICRNHNAVSINGTVRARAMDHDSKGRALPVWQGCERLTDDQIFVLTAPSASFDGRYFGAISRANVIERIEPLWTF
jgi:conjugative transfer signal peptidase TraF